MDSLDLALNVATRFTRSIHIRHDYTDAQAGLSGYQVTPLVLQTLDRMLAGLDTTSTERAFSIIGPYGSGKSAFGVFLAHYLRATPGLRRTMVRQHSIPDAQDILHHEAPVLLPVTVGGNNSALRPAIIEALREVIAGDRKLSGLRQPELPSSADYDPQAVADFVAQTAREVHETGAYAGVVVIVDELGQYLNYTARHGDERDLFVLQTLAEMAARSDDIPCLIVTILHQSFDRYTVSAGITRQTEWAKVQGRFVELPFQEPATQMIRMVSRALCPDDRRLTNWQLDWGERMATSAAELGLRPIDILPHEWTRLVARSYPLHPIVLVALPLLFRQLAQNERSLFAFLSSYEPWGLQDFVQQTALLGERPVYRLPHLYSYVETSLGASLFSRARGQRWAELAEARALLTDVSNTTRDVLTIIGTIGALGQSRGLRADQPLIAFALHDVPDDPEVKIALNLLQDHRQIIYRSYRQSFVIWEGSDLDLDDLTQQVRTEIAGHVALVDLLRQHAELLPLIAHRFSYQTGAVRQFATQFIDTTSLPQMYAPLQADGEVLYVVGADEEALDAARRWARSNDRSAESLRVVVTPRRAEDLRDVLLDVAALQQILTQETALEHDRAARREVAARLMEARHALSGVIERVYGTGHGQWFWCGREQLVHTARQIDELLSRACEAALPAAPHIWNELIVRHQLSSAAAKARRNLVELMLDRAHEELLGLQAYPPERAIYESVFRASGIHRLEGDGVWRLGPPPEDNPTRLRPVWDVMQQFLDTSTDAPRSVPELYVLLEAPPYGVKAGLIPLLFVAVYLANAGEVTLYEHGNFVPVPDIATFERLLRQPGYFAVRLSRVSGVRVAVFERLARALAPKALRKSGQPAILDAVTPLLRFIHDLPPYVRATRQVSAPAQAIRTALLTARAADELLFEALPQACDLTPFSSQSPTDPDRVAEFFIRLKTGLDELQRAHGVLLERMHGQLRSAFGASALEIDALREELASRYRLIAQATTDSQVRAVGVRLESGGPGSAWVESIAALVSRKPVEAWSDDDADAFALQIADLGRRFRLAEQIAFAAQRIPVDAPVLRVGIADGRGERSVVIERASDPESIRLRADLKATLDRYTGISSMRRTAVIAELLQSLLLDDANEE